MTDTHTHGITIVTHWIIQNKWVLTRVSSNRVDTESPSVLHSHPIPFGGILTGIGNQARRLWRSLLSVLLCA